MSQASTVLAAGLGRRFVAGDGTAVEAVRGVDLRVDPGEVVLVLGPSGSGKTTLLSMLGCLLRPTAGTLRVRDVEVGALPPERLPAFRLRNIGFVFQAFRLLDALSATENVEVPLDLAGIRRPQSRQRALALLDELGLADRAGFPPDALSAGEKQRVAVARALALDPPLLLADEPTASLDGRAGRVVIEMLCRASRQRGAALVIVGHDRRLIPQCDRVLGMEDGLLTEGAGDPAEAWDVQEEGSRHAG